MQKWEYMFLTATEFEDVDGDDISEAIVFEINSSHPERLQTEISPEGWQVAAKPEYALIGMMKMFRTLGEFGWELMTHTDDIFIFKRPLAD